jgi:small subunit ribosomal protein S2
MGVDVVTYMSVKIPSVEELLKAGVHFGHNESRWHPRMEPYIYTTRAGTHIIHLEKTREMLNAAAEFAAGVAAKGGVVLFLGTKRQAKAIVEAKAKECGAPVITGKWIGGLLTNWPTVSLKIKSLRKLKDQREKGELKKYTKREQLTIEREIAKLTDEVGGIESMTKPPEALFIIDIKEEKTALKEAGRMNIPVIALVDTNTNPDKADYPIPANDDAVKSLDLIIGSISQAIAAAKAAAPKEEKAESSQKKPAAKPATPKAAEPKKTETKETK